jgi:hypothetical protein
VTALLLVTPAGGTPVGHYLDFREIATLNWNASHTVFIPAEENATVRFSIGHNGSGETSCIASVTGEFVPIN